MYNATTWNENSFACKLTECYNWYLSKGSIGNNSTNSFLYLRTVREKYIHMYEAFIGQLHMHEKVVKILPKATCLFPFYPH